MLNWSMVRLVYFESRAICMTCETLFWARHLYGVNLFCCPECKLLTAVPVHA